MATNTTMTNIPNQPPTATPSASAPQPKEVKVVSVTETTQQPPAQQGQCSATNADPVPANIQAEYAQAQSAINQK